MSKIKQAAEEFKVPEDALPPRNKSEQDIMFAYMRGRKQGYLAGAKDVLKHAMENEEQWAIGDSVCGTGSVKISVLKDLFAEVKP